MTPALYTTSKTLQLVQHCISPIPMYASLQETLQSAVRKVYMLLV